MLWMKLRELDAVDEAAGTGCCGWNGGIKLDAVDDKLTVDCCAVVISWFSTPCWAQLRGLQYEE